MKRVVIGISLVLAMVAAAGLIPGWAQEAADRGQAATENWPSGNPLKIALLKWYQANLTTSFIVGKTKNSNPYGLAFDGQNMWTANSEGTVTKLRASDGAILGNFAVGGQANGVVFDGAQRVGDGQPEHGEQTTSQRREKSGRLQGGRRAVLAGLRWGEHLGAER
jgi:hypothetical protein